MLNNLTMSVNIHMKNVKTDSNNGGGQDKQCKGSDPFIIYY